jgi:hypothetical protein
LAGSISQDHRGRFGRRLAIGLVLALLALVAYAWIDGGREPVREIAQTIPVPGEAH